MKYLLIILIFLNNNALEFCATKNNDFEYLFAHGLAAGKKQLLYFQEIIPKPYTGIAFDCVDAIENPIFPYLLKIPPTSFGQEKDIDVLSKFIKESDKKIIGIGVSKGAACWINTIANEEYINKIAALVLESPFANVNEIIYSFKFVNYFNYIPFGQFIAKRMAQKILRYYNPSGLQPITSISKIKNKELPIYLIHSKEDKLIPINHSRKLYIEFLNQGFKNVYLIETEFGNHANILTNDPDKKFHKTIHSFYKKFGLPYDPNLIEYDIENFQPTIQEVEKRISADTKLINIYLPIIVKLLFSIILTYVFLKTFKKI